GSEYGLELRLLGVLPIERAHVSVVPPVEVIPSGQAIGILLSHRGVVVVRTVPVTTSSGDRVTPARDAGIPPGDILISAGGHSVHHPLDLQSIADYYGRRNQTLDLTLLRDGKEVKTRIRPVPRERTGNADSGYVLGLYLKDPAAGVGTLTFWEPTEGAY